MINGVFLRYEYEYRVCAENEAGEGQFSKVVGPVAARDRFGEPRPSPGLLSSPRSNF